MKKSSAIIFLFILIVFTLVLFIKSLDYNYRISLYFENKTTQDIDETWAANITNKLRAINGIWEVLSFSKPNNCNIYIKLNPFYLNKAQRLAGINMVFDSLINNLNFFNENIVFDFDLNNNRKIDYFLVFTIDNNDYEAFFDFEKELISFIVNRSITSKISLYPHNPFATYLYFDYDILKKNRLDTTKIKEIIDENNSNTSSFNQNINSRTYISNITSEIDSAEDIKNIAIFYLDNSFSTRLSDIIEVKNEIKNIDNSRIIYKNKNSIIYALSKKWYCFDSIYRYYLKKDIEKTTLKNTISYDLIKTNSLEKLSFNLDNTNLSNIQQEISNQINDDSSIYSINMTPIKISKKHGLEDFENKSLTIYFKKTKKEKLKNILSKLNLESSLNKKNYIIETKTLDELDREIDNLKTKSHITSISLTKKDLVILYNINNFYLNDYQIPKTELINSLIAHNEGLILDYYQNSFYRIPIILKYKAKNLNKSTSFVYSLQNNILLDTSSFLENKLEKRYVEIVRRNNKPISIVNIYND